MELMAAIAALEALKGPSHVDIHTDSAISCRRHQQLDPRLEEKGWRTRDSKPVKNAELWRRLEEAQHRHEVVWHWLRGHAGHTENERADELAREGMAPFLTRRS